MGVCVDDNEVLASVLGLRTLSVDLVNSVSLSLRVDLEVLVDCHGKHTIPSISRPRFTSSISPRQAGFPPISSAQGSLSRPDAHQRTSISINQEGQASMARTVDLDSVNKEGGKDDDKKLEWRSLG